MGFFRSNPDPLIIGGFFRSGTSLFRRLLDSHSRIHCGPEIKFFRDFYGDYRNDPYGHVRFFKTARHLEIEEPVLLEIFGSAFVRLHQNAAAIHGKPVWADKNPENVLYLDQWQKLLKGRFIFVHLVRDPRDVLASLLEIGFEKTVPTEFSDKVALFETYLSHARDFSIRFPEKSVQVRYEDLVTSPETTLTRFLKRIGLAFEPRMMTDFLDPARRAGIEDPKVCRQDRIHANSIGRWRNDLTPEQAALVRDRLGKISDFPDI